MALQTIQKGHLLLKKQPFAQGWHTSTEALLSLNGIIACTAVEGSMTKKRFLVFLEHNIMSFLSLPATQD
jgi:hypothetical protein